MVSLTKGKITARRGKGGEQSRTARRISREKKKQALQRIIREDKPPLKVDPSTSHSKNKKKNARGNAKKLKSHPVELNHESEVEEENEEEYSGPESEEESTSEVTASEGEEYLSEEEEEEYEEEEEVIEEREEERDGSKKRRSFPFNDKFASKITSSHPQTEEEKAARRREKKMQETERRKEEEEVIEGFIESESKERRKKRVAVRKNVGARPEEEEDLQNGKNEAEGHSEEVEDESMEVIPDPFNNTALLPRKRVVETMHGREKINVHFNLGSRWSIFTDVANTSRNMDEVFDVLTIHRAPDSKKIHAGKKPPKSVSIHFPLSLKK